MALKLKSIVQRFLSLVKKHPLVTAAVAVPVLAAGIAGILWATGVFGGNASQIRTPRRSFVLADDSKKEPETIQELLNQIEPDIEIFLRKPKLLEQLKQAKQVVDIVDSRFALNNLRGIQNKLDEYIAATDEDMPVAEYIPPDDFANETATTVSTSVGTTQSAAPTTSATQATKTTSKPTTKTTTPTTKTTTKGTTAPGTSPSTSATRTVATTSAPRPTSTQTTSVTAPTTTKKQQKSPIDQLREQQNKQYRAVAAEVNRLLQRPSTELDEELPAALNLKAIWSQPDEALVHMTPEGDWVPESGYRLYRVLDGKRELIYDNKNILKQIGQVASKVIDPKALLELSEAAVLSEQKLKTLAVNQAQFRSMAYRVDSLATRPVISGAADFDKMRTLKLTIPSTLEQKIPDSDQMLNAPIMMMNRSEGGRYNSSTIESQTRKLFSVIPLNVPSGTSLFGKTMNGAVKESLAQEILGARQQIASLSHMDEEYAEEVGFLFRDDLTPLKLPLGTSIQYEAEADGFARAVRLIRSGEELNLTTPTGFTAYGLDGRVPMRWDQPDNPDERAIICGYMVERQMPGEKDFKPITDRLIVITHQLDESNVFCESPVFHEDEAPNGVTVKYRVRSKDIFGRYSEYSAVYSVKVEKVTPPDRPTAVSVSDSNKLTWSSDFEKQVLMLSINGNSGKRGIILPIFAQTVDTERFIIYRASALGMQKFGPPAAIAEIKLGYPPINELPKDDEDDASKKIIYQPTADDLKHLIAKSMNGATQYICDARIDNVPDLVYFDADIKEGTTYKYWISALDAWNNESAWSSSAEVSIPTAKESPPPSEVSISMKLNELPDYSALPPGIVVDPKVSVSEMVAFWSNKGEAMDPRLIQLTDEQKKADASGWDLAPLLKHRNFSELADVDTKTLSDARKLGLVFGQNTSGQALVRDFDLRFDCLPDQKNFHMFIGVEGKSVLPDGTVRIKWPAYSGSGISGYSVYQTKYDLGKISDFNQLMKKSKEEILRLGGWRKLNDKPLTQNQMLIGGMPKDAKTGWIFLICLEMEKPDADSDPSSLHVKLANIMVDAWVTDGIEGGFVYLSWPVPNDPQVQFYRVYRSEVATFKKEFDEGKLEWTLVGDLLTKPAFSERVDQSHARYFIYKITSVTKWGVESQSGLTKRFRVPSTKPPQTPNILLPLSKKDGIQINFSSVPYCDWYDIYRAEIPRLYLKDIEAIEGGLFQNIAHTPEPIVSMSHIQTQQLLQNQQEYQALLSLQPKPALTLNPFAAIMGSHWSFLSAGGVPAANKSGIGINPYQPATGSGASQAPAKFMSPASSSSGDLVNQLERVSPMTKREAVNRLIDQYGPLAMSDYGDLSLKQLTRIKWVKVGEVPSDPDLVEEVDPSTGLLKPLSFIDTTPEYGIKYLYTVQAWNDDKLGSCRPEPVEAATRRNKPFDPLKNLTCTIASDGILLSWSKPTQKNLTAKRIDAETVGYFVYRANSQEGPYYQVSPLLFDPLWKDTQSDPFANNWYKVRVLDTGGYLSDFSEPVSRVKKLNYQPAQPQVDPLPPRGGASTSAPTTTTTPATRPTTAPPPTTTRRTEPKVAPVFKPREDQYYIEVNTYSGSATVQFELSEGTPPISWHVRTAGIIDIPSDAFKINQDGVLTVSEWLSERTYDIVLRATNEVGWKEQEVIISVVKKFTIPVIPRFTIPYLPGRGLSRLGASPVSANDGQSWSLLSGGDRFSAGDLGFLTDAQLARTPETNPYYRYPAGSALVLSLDIKVSQAKMKSYNLVDLDLYYVANPGRHITGAPIEPGYFGTCKLVIKHESGDQISIPVNVYSAWISVSNQGYKFEKGRLAMPEVTRFPERGLTLSRLMMNDSLEEPLVDGLIHHPDNDQMLVGSLAPVLFRNARLTPEGGLALDDNLPDFTSEAISFHDGMDVKIQLLNQKTTDRFVSFFAREITVRLPLETLRCEGIEIGRGEVLLDIDGKTTMRQYTPGSPQCLQFLVPGGAMLEVESATLCLKRGELDTKSDGGKLIGKVYLPFETATATGAGTPSYYTQDFHPDRNELDDFREGKYSSSSPELNELLNWLLLQAGRNVQQNAVLLVPPDAKDRKNCAYSAIKIDNWDGGGFTVANSKLSPVRIADRSLGTGKQRDQAIILTSGSVRLDFDPDDFLPKGAAKDTPNETEQPFWTGIVVNSGSLQLPTAFLQTKDRKPIVFNLKPGELIYDLNGFNYQTYLFAGTDEGVPAVFGSSLGGFDDVRVHDCLLDLYANKINLEVNADVGLEMFDQKRVNVKLYTNKETNADTKAGEWLCSVASATLSGFAGKGVELEIKGGFFKPTGLVVGGSLKINTQDIQTPTPLPFTSMTIPAKKEKTNRANDALREIGKTALDKTTSLVFKGFPMDVRSFDLEYMAAKAGQDITTQLKLMGSTMLSDNLPVGQTSTDDILTAWGGKAKDYLENGPGVLYEQSKSVLDANFDRCIDIGGVLVPKVLKASKEGLIEFSAEELKLSFLEQPGILPIETVTRFGFDLDLKRPYYAVGILPREGGSGEINLGGGNIRDFAGLVAYNMVVNRDSENRFEFPRGRNEMKQFIANLQVNRDSKGAFAAGIRGTMTISKLCEVRDLYFGFEPGPRVTASGGLYVPLEVASIVTGAGDAFKEVGKVIITYSHPERYFSFNMTLSGIDVVAARVSGSLGFEFSPHLFGLYLGYPETLVGNIGIWHFGVGLGFRIDDEGTSLIKAKIEFGLEKTAEVAIVYLRGYLYVGADGAYYFGVKNPETGKIDGPMFVLTLYLKGGLEGGIKVGGKRYNIISFYLDARGTIRSVPPDSAWYLECSAKVSYSLDLWLFSVSGSVSASFDTRLR